MLPSLRPLIADGMRAMALCQSAFHVTAGGLRLLDGARTLEWCDANDPNNALGGCEDFAAEVEDRNDRLASIEDALQDWTLTKMKQPAAFRDRLTKLLED